MNIRDWLQRHSLKLLAIRDTPQAIAGGVAIGVFFGFMPLFGFKTLLAIFFAWLTGSNILAAVIAGTLHDVILPFMPIIYRWEYDIGYWLLSSPHHLPHRLGKMHWEGPSWRFWEGFSGQEWLTFFRSVGKKLVLGGFICATPFSILSFFVTRRIVFRHQLKKAAQSAVVEEEANPS